MNARTEATYQGIPARARVGFAGCFVRDRFLDHEVAEVWDAREQRWRLIDPEMPDTFTDPTDDAVIDALDVPRDRFQVGGEAWARCRAGQADPERYVVDPGLDIPVTRGCLQLRHNLVQDLAALNKRQMILWDTWGILDDNPIPDDQATMLDGIAAVTRRMWLSHPSSPTSIPLPERPQRCLRRVDRCPVDHNGHLFHNQEIRNITEVNRQLH